LFHAKLGFTGQPDCTLSKPTVFARQSIGALPDKLRHRVPTAVFDVMKGR
jgi:hypothetical protein